MENFRAALAQYLIGALEVADLEAAIDRALGEHPDAAPRLTEMLDDLFGKGRLPHQIYALLKRRIQSSASASGADEGATRFQMPQASGEAAASDEATRFQPPPVAATPPGGAAEEATRFKPPPAQPEGAGGADDSATRIAPAAGIGPVAGAAGLGSAADAGVTASTAARTGSSASQASGVTGGLTASTGRSTGSNWSHPSQWTGAGSGGQNQPIDLGSIVKGRFVLEGVLGQGGMGKVFKARDLRKEEAQDRNPFVALKILNEDFKRHPQALQALQREARKAQDLAHPNIVTVWDFDRDGDNVYMTMEHLEGESLDRFNKRHSLQGIPVADALRLVEGMAQGLAYAHRQGIVHSDFKPANAFLTKSGDIKIFDFGIARAAKRPTDLEGEKTLFDAGDLGALTPAYASCEMLEGGEPDPRDDIYALAIVTYELIAGRHPFDKKSAVKARDEGLKPERLKGLTARQWKTLANGLAFARADRSPSVEAFMEGMRPRIIKRGQLAVGAVAVAALVTVLALMVPQYLAQFKVESLIATITAGPDEAVTAVLPELKELPADQFRSVFLDESTTAAFIAYYTRRVRALWDPSAGRFDFAKAGEPFAELSAFFPDSRSVGDLERRLQEERDDTIADLYQELDRVRDAGQLIPAQGEGNVVDVLATIARIDPADPRLKDQAVPIRFAEVAAQLLDAGDTDLGSQVIDEGLRITAEDVSLLNLRDRARNLREQLQREQRIAELETALAERRAELAAGGDPIALRDVVVELGRLDDGNAALADARRDMDRLLVTRLAPLVDGSSFAAATQLLDELGGAASADFVRAERERIGGLAAARQSDLEKLQAELSEAIAQDRLEGGGGSAVALLERLAALGGAPELLADARASTAEAFAARGTRARNAGNWQDARRALEAALAVNPPETVQTRLRNDLELVAQLEQRAAVTAEGERQRLLAEQRSADIERLQNSFDERLGAQSFALAQARGALTDLRALSDYGAAPADGEQRVAARLRSEVERLAKDDDLTEATRLAERSAQLMPNDPTLSGLLQWVQAESAARLAAAARREVETLSAEFDTLIADARLDKSWDDQVRALLRRYEGAVGAGAGDLVDKQRRVAELYIAAARSSREDERFENAASQLDRANSYAPDLASLAEERNALARSREAAQQEVAARAREADIERLKNNLKAEAARGNVAGATAILDELKGKAQQDPFVLRTGPELIAQSYLDLAGKELRDGRLDRARSLIDLAKGLAPGYGAIAEVEAQLESASEAVAEAPPAAAPPALPEQADSTADREVLAGIQRALTSDQPLNSQAIGEALRDIGTRNKALIVELEPELVEAAVSRIDALASGQRAAAEQRLAAARALFPDNARLAAYRLPEAPAIAQGPDPCANPDLVGRGKIPRAMCRDTLSGRVQGPPLVVIPSGGPFSRPVAISKYEIMIGDYNAYCELSANCKPRSGDRTLPLTGITVQEAEAFVEWLGKVTGARYRLPTAAEWEYAANAGGEQPPKDFNCEVRQNNVPIKGLTLMPVNTGEDNGWGLKNYVGNAQEWVKSGSAWEARGGAHTTSMSQCDLRFGTSHSGSADAITGFRVLRELG